MVLYIHSDCRLPSLETGHKLSTFWIVHMLPQMPNSSSWHMRPTNSNSRASLTFSILKLVKLCSLDKWLKPVRDGLLSMLSALSVLHRVIEAIDLIEPQPVLSASKP